MQASSSFGVNFRVNWRHSPQKLFNRKSELFIRLFRKVSSVFLLLRSKFFMNNVKFSPIMQKWFFLRMKKHSEHAKRLCLLVERHLWRNDDGKICASLIRFSIREEGLPTFLRVPSFSFPFERSKVRLERESRRWTFNSERADRINRGNLLQEGWKMHKQTRLHRYNGILHLCGARRDRGVSCFMRSKWNLWL